MLSTNTYIPYFYIIQHKLTKIMYAGSRWAKKYHFNEFMTPNGYQTSSKQIKSIIEQEGLDIFEIIRIDTFCDNIHVYEYETAFLQTLDCANSDDWYNQHNNYYGRMVFGLPKFKEKATNLLKYGVEYCMKNPKTVEKLIHKFNKIWG